MAALFYVLGCPVLDSIITVDKNVAEELAAIVCQDLRKVIFNLLHGLVVWRHSGPD